MQPTLWQQIYDPFGSMTISTLMGAVPVVVMLVGIGFLHMKAHVAAGAGLLAALAIAVEPDISPDLPQALATQHIASACC